MNSLIFAILSTIIAAVQGEIEDLVLGGNYGSSKDNIPDLRSMRREEKHALQFLQPGSLLGQNTLLGHDTLLQQSTLLGQDTLLGQGTADVRTMLSGYLQIYSANYKELMKRAEVERLHLSKVQMDEVCMRSLNNCNRTTTDKRKCYLHCVLTQSDDDHLQSIQQLVEQAVDDLCKPLKTAFERIFNSEEGRASFRSYKNFRTLLGITEQTLKTIVAQFTNSITGAIIQHTNTPFLPLKIMISDLHKYLRTGGHDENYDVQNNPACMGLLPFQTYEIFGAAVRRDTSFEDLLLPGHLFLSSVSKYISSKASPRITALMEINRLLSGSVSGFGCSKKGGEIAISTGTHDGEGLCDELGKAPTLGFPLPPQVNGNDATSFFSISYPVCTNIVTIGEEPVVNEPKGSGSNSKPGSKSKNKKKKISKQ